MHVGVEIAGLDRLLEERVNEPACNGIKVMTGSYQSLAVRDFYPVNPVKRQHPARRAVPVDSGNLIFVHLGHMFGQLRCAGRLAAQVQFAYGPATEIGDDQLRTQTLCLTPQSLEMCRGPFVGFDIPGKFLDDTRTQYFYGNIPTFKRGRAVNLRN